MVEGTKINIQYDEEIQAMICQELLSELMTSAETSRENLAGRLLLVCTYLNPQDIWLDLLQKGQAHPDTNNWFRDAMKDEKEFKAIAQILIDRNLITADRDLKSFTIHEKVREYLTRSSYRTGENTEGEDKEEEYVRIAISCVAFSDCSDLHPRVEAIRRRLLPHVDTVFESLRRHKGFGLKGFFTKDLKPEKFAILESVTGRESWKPFQKPPRRYTPWQTVLHRHIDQKGKPEDLAEARKVAEAIYKTWEKTTSSDLVSERCLELVESGQLLGTICYRMNEYEESMRIASDLKIYSENDVVLREGVTMLHTLSKLRCNKAFGPEAGIIARCVDDRITQLFPGTRESFDILPDVAYLNGAANKHDQAKEVEKRMLLETIDILGITDPVSQSDVPLIPWPVMRSGSRLAAKKVEEFIDLYAGDNYLLQQRAWEGLSEALPEGHEYTLRQGEGLSVLHSEKKQFESCIKIRLELDKHFTKNQPDIERVGQNLWGLVTAYNGKVGKLLGPTRDDETTWSKNRPAIEQALADAVKCLLRSEYPRRDMTALAAKLSTSSFLILMKNYDSSQELLDDVLEVLEDLPESDTQLSQYTIALETQIDIGIKQGDQTQETSNKTNTALEKLCKVSTDSTSKDRNTAMLTQQAEAYFRCGKLGKGIEFLQSLRDAQVPELGSEDPQILDLDYTLAYQYLESGELLEAKARLETLLRSLAKMSAMLEDQNKVNSTANEDASKAIPVDLEYIQVIEYAATVCIAKIFVIQENPDYERANELLRPCVEYYQQCKKFENQAVVLLPMFQNAAVQGRKPYEAGEILLDLIWLVRDNPEAIPNWVELKVLNLQVKTGTVLEGGHPYSHARVMERLLTLLNQEEQPDDEAILTVEKKLRRCYWEADDLFSALRHVENRGEVIWKKFQECGQVEANDYLFLSELCIAYACRIGREVEARTVAFALLRHSEETYGVDDARTLNVFRVFKVVEDASLRPRRAIPDTSFDSDGLLVVRNAEGCDVFWTNYLDESDDSTTTDLLSSYKWETLLLCGKPDLILAELEKHHQHLRDQLTYNPPPGGPDTVLWPRSWTFIPGVHQTVDRRWSIPLRIAGAPVVIPAPQCSYSISQTFQPVEDPVSDIDPSTYISNITALHIFEVFEFAIACYIFINGVLQIVVEDNLDVVWAVMNRPRTYGGLKVEYVHMGLIPTAGRNRNRGLAQDENRENQKKLGQDAPLQLHSPIYARHKEKKGGKKDEFECRVGLPVRHRSSKREFITTATYPLWEAENSKGGLSRCISKFLPQKKPKYWAENIHITHRSGGEFQVVSIYIFMTLQLASWLLFIFSLLHIFLTLHFFFIFFFFLSNPLQISKRHFLFLKLIF